MSRADLAKSNFMKGYNCSQAVLLAFADLAHLDEETALKISSSFGGGMGRMREVCGTVSGIFMAAGMIFYDAGAPRRKKKAISTRSCRNWRGALKRKTAVSSAANFCRASIPIPRP